MEPLLIAGLGNPGDEYALTRHNAGLDFINLLCENYSLNLKKENQINGYFAEYETESYKLILVTPSTYMNDSGLCISKCKKFFNLNTNQLSFISFIQTNCSNNSSDCTLYKLIKGESGRPKSGRPDSRRAAAARLEPSQQLRERRSPVRLRWYCQCGRRTIALGGLL